MLEAFSEYGLLGLVLLACGGFGGWLIRDQRMDSKAHVKAYHDHLTRDTERYITILEKNSNAMDNFARAMEMNTRSQQQTLEMVIGMSGKTQQAPSE